LSLRIADDNDSATIGRVISFGIRQALRSDPNLRLRTVNWELSGNSSFFKRDEVQISLCHVWNGTRRLPYSDAEIAESMGAAAALTVKNLADALSRDDHKAIFETVFGESRLVEFGTIDGSGSKGFVETSVLRDALRPDMKSLLASEYVTFPDDFYDLFRIIYNPRLMFPFDKFKSLFVRQVIPAQVANRRPLILFNSARLKTFGNP